MKIVIFEQMTVQDAFLAQLEPIWVPTRVSKGAQDEPKTEPRRVQNRVQNRTEKVIEKWTAQGSMPGIGSGHVRPQVPTEGVRGGSTKQPKDQYPRSSTPMGSLPLRPANVFSSNSNNSIVLNRSQKRNDTSKGLARLCVKQS